jgi:hypothetical protein
MRKLGRLWDWVLPGLISLSPSGAIAYYEVVAEKEASRDESPRVGLRALVFDPLPGRSVVPLARQ